MKTISILFSSVCLGFAAAQFTPRTIAADLKITSESGTLKGCDVMQNGETVCSEPFVSVKLQIIECD